MIHQHEQGNLADVKRYSEQTSHRGGAKPAG